MNKLEKELEKEIINILEKKEKIKIKEKTTFFALELNEKRTKKFLLMTIFYLMKENKRLSKLLSNIF